MFKFSTILELSPSVSQVLPSSLYDHLRIYETEKIEVEDLPIVLESNLGRKLEFVRTVN